MIRGRRVRRTHFLVDYSAEREILQQHQRQPQREQRAHNDHTHEAHRAEGLLLNAGVARVGLLGVDNDGDGLLNLRPIWGASMRPLGRERATPATRSSAHRHACATRRAGRMFPPSVLHTEDIPRCDPVTRLNTALEGRYRLERKVVLKVLVPKEG